MSRGSSTRKRTERQGKTIQLKDHEREVSEEAKSRDVGRNKEKKEVNEDGRYSQCRGRRRSG